MNDNQKQYWKGIEQLTNDPEFVKHADQEFPGYLSIKDNKQKGEESSSGSSRRDFLKMMGFSIAAASLASCEAPVRHAIPYLNKPVEVDPGIPNYYASTYVNGGDYCSVVVKTREGRPIKIEGNKLSSITRGGISAQVDASVLSLYDDERLKSPSIDKTTVEWAQLDREIITRLTAIANAGGQIRIVSNTILSPSTKSVIADFIQRYPTASHVMYDSFSVHGMRVANERSFGQAVIPSYDFSQANVIVAFGGADFLGTWISPIEFTKQYSRTRKIGKNKKTMSRHFQFESNLSLTGANADYRTPIRASQEGVAIAALYNLVVGGAGGNAAAEFPNLEKAAQELLANRGRSIVVSGSNDPNVQVVVNAINAHLGNYGTTINLGLPVNFRQGDDVAMNRFINDVNAGNIRAVIFFNSNPVYDHPAGAVLAQALQKVELSVATNDRMDETASLVKYVAPDSHYLESWNDAEPKPGFYSLTQPAITPIFHTRQAQESLLLWSSQPELNYYNYLQNFWRSNLFTGGGNFQTFWDTTLFNGVLEPQNVPAGQDVSFGGNVSSALQAINKPPQANGVELVIYQKIGIGNGSMANNPWLQELPDPVTKACWDNYLTIPVGMVEQLNYRTNEGRSTMVTLTVGDMPPVTLPVIVQPGQAPGTVGLAIGYGRTNAGKVGNNVGVNAYPYLRNVNGSQIQFISEGVRLEGSSNWYAVAQTQTHETYMGREFVVQESILPLYQENPKAGRYMPKIATKKGPVEPEKISLWQGHKYPNHYWGWAIDMNSCTGCSACMVACQSENNVPVVGRDEVLNRREMHWIRIDRYYSSKTAGSYRELEVAAENPEVTFQVMTCQHCNNAPCETVCPVAATTHSTEGINQMAYNRCIGTRYCANNCPYKVRRFNWFKYHTNDKFANVNPSMNSSLGRMVLNPDVTVRSRGVMEKCTLCIQRIQLGKLEAKKQGRRPIDGEIITACASACPADAIVFGDMNDPESQIVKLLNDEVEGRAYHVLEELNTNPNTFYLTKIRNKDKEDKNV